MTVIDYIIVIFVTVVIFCVLATLLFGSNKKSIIKDQQPTLPAINPAPVFSAKLVDVDENQNHWTNDWRNEPTEVDPCAEAEVYLAYGREAQALEILKEAIAKTNNPYAHLMIIELYKPHLKTQPELEALIANHRQAIKDSGQKEAIDKNAQREALELGKPWYQDSGGNDIQKPADLPLSNHKLWVHLFKSDGIGRDTATQLEINISHPWPSIAASVELKTYLDKEFSANKYVILQVFVLA